MDPGDAPTLDTFTHHDGYPARVRWWTPSAPRGALLYLHGIQSHGSWYEASAAALARAGFVVLLPDRRGSGLNPRDRGHVTHHDIWLRDLDDLLAAVCARASASAAHVVGVSWGGKLAAAAAAAGVPRIATLSLVAPGVFPRVDLPFAEKLRVAWSIVSEPLRAFPIPLDDPRLFTANPARIDYVRTDDLRLREVTGAFLIASRRLDHKARDLPRAAWNGPAHLMLAGHDRIIDNAPTRAWFNRLRSGRLRLTEYPDAFHTLEFEPDPRPFIDDLVEWIAANPA